MLICSRGRCSRKIDNKQYRQGKTLDGIVCLRYNSFMIEKRVRIGHLYDYYGPLLTDRQQKCLELHYLQDLSLGEIAGEMGVSRQAINDILRRTEEMLEEYETCLGLVRENATQTQLLQNVDALLESMLQQKSFDPRKLEQARELLEKILK